MLDHEYSPGEEQSLREKYDGVIFLKNAKNHERVANFFGIPKEDVTRAFSENDREYTWEDAETAFGIPKLELLRRWDSSIRAMHAEKQRREPTPEERAMDTERYTLEDYFVMRAAIGNEKDSLNIPFKEKYSLRDFVNNSGFAMDAETFEARLREGFRIANEMPRHAIEETIATQTVEPSPLPSFEAMPENINNAEALETHWQMTIENLKKEYDTRRAELPLKELRGAEIVEAIKKNDDVWDVAYAKVVQQVRQSDDFAFLRDAGFSVYSKEHNLIDSPFPVTRRDSKSAKAGHRGMYKDGVVILYTEAIRQRDNEFSTLGTVMDGMLTNETEVIIHESIHGLQIQKPSVEARYSRDPMTRALLEMHAFFSDEPLSPKGSGTQGREFMRELLTKEYAIPARAADYAVKVITELKALQIPDTTIAGLISGNDDWSEQTGVSESLEIKLATIRAKEKVPEGTNLEALYDVRHWQRRLLGLQLANIVRSEAARVMTHAHVERVKEERARGGIG